MEHLETFRRVSFLEDLTEEELGFVVQASEGKHFEKGDVVIEEASRGEGLYVINNGKALVTKALKDGEQKTISELYQGDHFGEMSLVTDKPTSASVIADGAMRCLFISSEKFMRLIYDHPSIGRKVLWAFVQTLSNRLAESDRRYARMIEQRDRFAAVRHLVSVGWMQTRILFSYVWVWIRKHLLFFPHSEASLSRIHRQNAIRFKKVAFKLKGANIKTGQIASMQAHILPPEFIEEFKEMRDNVTHTEYPLIAGMIQAEFGVGPLELFADFDKVPIAAASMGQVHTARLHSGEKVVVKVLHPGLERSVEIDLWLIRQFVRTLGLFSKKWDLNQIYREFEEPLRKEMDLLYEAQSTELMSKELAKFDVTVPKVYWRYSTRRVLTLEFIDGVNLDNLEQIKAWEIDRVKLMQTYLRAFFQQVFLGGFFHADPHPANAFCTPEGKLALLDFGMVKRLPDHVREGLLKEIFGGFFFNIPLWASGLIQKGACKEEDRPILEKWGKKYLSDPKVRAALFDHEIEDRKEMADIFGNMTEMIDELSTFETPQDNLMVARAIGIVTDVCREVVPEKPVSQMATPIMMPIFTEILKQHPEFGKVEDSPVVSGAMGNQRGEAASE
ncbi:MAG: cyclic nucleotide-binding domain-containing protein [Chrysiogenetes bacterium]|nr:cyclic nucleotide-binding domain-containing protein [Chrysiogenetes bacterium]